MTKVVINNTFGGFGLSNEAVLRYAELVGKKIWVIDEEYFPTYSLVPPEERADANEKRGIAPDNWWEMTLEEKSQYNQKWSEQTFQPREIARDDPFLIQVVDELGKKADGSHAELKIVEIPDDVEWQIEEYDGSEWVAEKHRTWS